MKNIFSLSCGNNFAFNFLNKISKKIILFFFSQICRMSSTYEEEHFPYVQFTYHSTASHIKLDSQSKLLLDKNSNLFNSQDVYL